MSDVQKKKQFKSRNEITAKRKKQQESFPCYILPWQKRWFHKIISENKWYQIFYQIMQNQLWHTQVKKLVLTSKIRKRPTLSIVMMLCTMIMSRNTLCRLYHRSIMQNKKRAMEHSGWDKNFHLFVHSEKSAHKTPDVYSFNIIGKEDFHLLVHSEESAYKTPDINSFNIIGK